MKKKYEKPEMITQEMAMDMLRACANTGPACRRETRSKVPITTVIHISSGGAGFKHLSLAT